MAKRVNPRRVKRHRNYTIEEAARALGVAKATVRNWIAKGLPILKDQRPFLILGGDLIAYLEASAPKKQSCQPHQCFCFRCRCPRDPRLAARAGRATEQRVLLIRVGLVSA